MATEKKRKQPAAKPAKEKQAAASSTSLESEAIGRPANEMTPIDFPVVGIGASAGGLAAFEAFFSAMPAGVDPGMAFVLVQHLSPDHKSMLPEILQRCTTMPVLEAEDGMVVRRNCVYTILPGWDLAFSNGTLKLLKPSAARGHRTPIDFFFESLAQDQRERAIGIVLSGTGSDGTLGIGAIKQAGGMVMVQNPDSSEYDGMPNSVIDAGLAHYVVSPEEMPARLIAYVADAWGKQTPAASVQDSAPYPAEALDQVFVLLRSHTGHDFSQYKPSSICRRVERRMALHLIETMEAYVRYLQKNPIELDALFRELLIGVTHFFRDAEAFKALEEQGIPELLAGHSPELPIRVWVPSCSTGEEAYSIAILLYEQLEAHEKTWPVLIFATDIDSRAISKARVGLYPSALVGGLTQERLSRFFTTEDNGKHYRIHKVIRDMVTFSVQNVIKDPPFSRMDLISCRNLMIYLDGELQEKLISLFHYALNPKGILFLGTSETVGKFQELFSILDGKSKLFQRKELPAGTGRARVATLLPKQHGKEQAVAYEPEKKADGKSLSLRELTERELLKSIPSAAVLVTGQGDALYLHGKTGMYLEPAPGEVKTPNILTMARKGLERELQTALRAAVSKKRIIHRYGLLVKTNGHFTAVDMTVRPVKMGEASSRETYLYLVILEDVSKHHADGYQEAVASGTDQGMSQRIKTLQQEMLSEEAYHKSANELLEASNDELKSSREELQSLNQELQSTNEELETSKEELQSINEELTTVNGELQAKIGQLSRANNDMNNLLAGTGIATVFIDQELRVLRFTPSATAITNLILSDIGRPVAHIAPNLVGYTHLAADAKAVLDTLIPKEMEVKALDGQWYTMRIQPYRTLDNAIEGAVITFVNITEIVKIRESLKKASELNRLAVVVKDSNDAITVQDLAGSILAWNPGAVRMYGWSEAEALGMHAEERIPESKRTSETAVLRQLALSKVLEPYRTQRLTKDGTVLDLVLTATALMDESGSMYAIATTERMIT